MTRLFHLLDVTRFPALVDRRLSGAVESEYGEISSAGHSGKPVAFFALRRFRSEVEIRAAVGVLRRLVTRTERGKRLAVGEIRSVFSLVERHGPEVGGRNVGWQAQAIAVAARQRTQVDIPP